MTDHSDIDKVTGTATTGHEWDGIKELNTPLPRWWIITFYACIVWAVGYWIVYPAWPLVSGYTSGVLHYSSRADVAVELANLEKIRGAKMVTLGAASLAESLYAQKAHAARTRMPSGWLRVAGLIGAIVATGGPTDKSRRTGFTATKLLGGCA